MVYVFWSIPELVDGLKAIIITIAKTTASSVNVLDRKDEHS